jgi:hypothetical protein
MQSDSISCLGVVRAGGNVCGMATLLPAKGVRCIMAALRILPAEAHPMDLRVGLPEPLRARGPQQHEEDQGKTLDFVALRTGALARRLGPWE